MNTWELQLLKRGSEIHIQMTSNHSLFSSKCLSTHKEKASMLSDTHFTDIYYFLLRYTGNGMLLRWYVEKTQKKLAPPNFFSKLMKTSKSGDLFDLIFITLQTIGRSAHPHNELMSNCQPVNKKKSVCIFREWRYDPSMSGLIWIGNCVTNPRINLCFCPSSHKHGRFIAMSLF